MGLFLPAERSWPPAPGLKTVSILADYTFEFIISLTTQRSIDWLPEPSTTLINYTASLKSREHSQSNLSTQVEQEFTSSYAFSLKSLMMGYLKVRQAMRMC